MTARVLEQLRGVLPETSLFESPFSDSVPAPESPPCLGAPLLGRGLGEAGLPAVGLGEGGAEVGVAPVGIDAIDVDCRVEGSGVILERPLPLGVNHMRGPVPPLPREDPAPEPVSGREWGFRDPTGRFKRNPAVSEALEELSRPPAVPAGAESSAALLRKRRGKESGNALRLPAEGRQIFTPQQRLLLLDTWSRSGLPAGDFAVLVGLSKHTLYLWKRRFDECGPAGLEDNPRAGSGLNRLSEITKRAILMLKRAHPEYGCERISDLLARGPALPASAGTVARALREAGYESSEQPTRRHPDRVRRFERESPNSLWQTDLFTFVLKRQNRRLHMVVFMDDHSRFVTGWGLFSSPSTEMVVEALRSAVSSFQSPAELLTDNGPQYVTWRGKSKFSEACLSLGIKQIVARPRRPQTLGKVERFWGTLWREFLGTAIFADVPDARIRIGRFMDYYNFQRPHQSLEGLSPADRYFGKSSEVKEALRRRLEENVVLLGRRLDELESAPLTPDSSPEAESAVDEIPGPGFDGLSEGLAAAVAAGGGGVEA